MLTFAHSSYFQDLLGSFSAGVVICNSKGLVYAQNEAATAILGVSPDELADPGQAATIIGRATAPRVVARFLAAPLKHARKPVPITVTYRHPDGRPRHLHLSGSLLVEYDKIFGILIEINDVTEIFALHERERAMLLGIQAAQQERIESLGHFALAVAHQIRNPLMVIGGFAGRLLRRRAPDDPETETLGMILDGAKRLEAVVTAVSGFTRQRSPVPAPVDPAAVAGRAMEAARRRTGSRAGCELTADGGEAVTDAALLEEILIELCANALEAQAAAATTAPGETPEAIRVDIAPVDDALVVTVTDQGTGIPGEARPFIFDPFFTTKAVGVGMGLAIAKRDAEELGGSLRLITAPHGGCTAELILPQSRPGPRTARPGQAAATLP